MTRPKLAFADTFFSSQAKLAPNIQAKVNNLVLKFQTNPQSSGLNYEKLNAIKDANLRSLRVDQAYRVILSAPENSGVYLMLWVDHHDKAYEWAAKHKCSVNPNTGSVQLYAVETVIETEYVTSLASNEQPLFDGLKDRQLLKLGVPEEQLELVREIRTDEHLDSLQSVLPQEAYEGLFFITSGDSYESILLDREQDESDEFDTHNFAEALARIQSQSRFVVPSDEEELSTVLSGSLEKWRVFLHSSQRKVAFGTKNGPVRVLGGAGTGKTVVAMHRAKWLAANIASDDKKILFTTFTKNLAVDIQNNLKTICSEEELSRIEVLNLDRWVQGFLRKQSYDYTIIYDEKVLNGYWQRALSEKSPELDLPDSFFKEEWQRVVQPQGVASAEDYKKASRIGRGTRLNRQQRLDIWRVFEEYRHQLNRAQQKEVDDCFRDARSLIEGESLDLPYCAIVVDEAQDMGTQAFSLLRAMVDEGQNDLFIVGDAHQRIYGRNKVVLSRCGINIRGRSRKLKINYRTTDEIRRWAVSLLEGRSIDDLDGGDDDNTRYKSLTHGQPPVIQSFTSADEQADFICALLKQLDTPLSHWCVVSRTNNETTSIQTLLSERGIATSIIKASEPETTDENVLHLATIHRVKGLEFDQVILASANEGLIPLEFAMRDKADEVSRGQAETEERGLVYVAITRARRAAYVLSYGKESPFLSSAGS
jgi:superfamily I DNA/RNA helicase/mRNA-degrading endonuclease RelE of RelBE toxin-antitoxin system